MSEEQAYDNVERDMGSQPLFDTAVEAVGTEQYLGDLSVVQNILMFWMSYVLEKLSQVEAKDDQLHILKRASTKLAYIFHGRDRDYLPVRNWNQPGSIDAHVGKWCGSSEANPETRMEHCFVVFFGKVIEIASQAADPGILDEQWQGGIEAEVQYMAYLLVGMDPVTMDIVSIEATNE